MFVSPCGDPGSERLHRLASASRGFTAALSIDGHYFLRRSIAGDARSGSDVFGNDSRGPAPPGIDAAARRINRRRTDGDEPRGRGGAAPAADRNYPRGGGGAGPRGMRDPATGHEMEEERGGAAV